jgi:DNA-binding CsgD family transcriptional regulator
MDTGLDPTTPIARKKDPVRSLARLGVDLFQVLACVADEVIVLDRDRRLVALIGDSPDEPFRRETAAGTLRDLFGPQVADAHEAGCAAALEGRYSAYEWIRRRGRQSLQLFTTASPLRDAAAHIVGIVLLTRMVGALSRDQTAIVASLAEATGRLVEVEERMRQLADALERYRRSKRVLATFRADSPLQHISSRERQVLELLGQGYRPRSIAEKLHVSPDTVRNHLKAMFKKTGTHSQEELTALLRAARNVH